MKRSALIFEKIFACIEILFACFLLGADYNQLMEEGERVADRGNPTLRLSEIAHHVEMFVIPLLFLAGGVLLLLSKPFGWIISVSLSLFFLVFILQFGLFDTSPKGIEWLQFALYFLAGSLLMIFLSQKLFRVKCRIGKKQWLTVALLVILVSLTSYWQRIF